MDGRRTVAEIAKQVSGGANKADVQQAIRSMAERGLVALLAKPVGLGEITRKFNDRCTATATAKA